MQNTHVCINTINPMCLFTRENGVRRRWVRDEERIVSIQNGLTIRKSEMQLCNFVIRWIFHFVDTSMWWPYCIHNGMQSALCSVQCAYISIHYPGMQFSDVNNKMAAEWYRSNNSNNHNPFGAIDSIWFFYCCLHFFFYFTRRHSAIINFIVTFD